MYLNMLGQHKSGLMAQDTVPNMESPRRRSGLLRDQVQLVKRKDSDRYEIVPIQDPLSFEKGFFVVIRACKLLAQKNEGIIIVGVAGPSGAGKTVFTEKLLNFMPSIAVITMDNYNDSSRIIDGNFDDPRLTDYDTLLENIHGLKEGKAVQSTRAVSVEQIKAVLLEEHKETTEEAYDIYLLPPGEDPEACQSYLRMRNRDGKYNLMFEEWVTDSPFIISPRITFEVSVRLLGGLMALGYTIAAILKRNSHIFSDDRVCVKIDWLEQLNRKYVQVQGRDRMYVKFIAEQLGLDGSYIAHTYIEQIQREKLVNDVMALPDDLKTKLSIDDDLVSSPREALSRASADCRMKYLKRSLSHSYSTQRDKNLSKLTKLAVNTRRYDGRTPDSPATSVANQGIITQLSEQISTLNERMDDFTSRIEELNSKLSVRKVSASQQNMALQAEACNSYAPTSLFMAGLNNGSLTGSMIPNSASSSQLAKESPLMEEVLLIARGQRQIMHQIDNLTNLLNEYQRERSREGRTDATSRTIDVESIGVSIILTLAIGGLGIFLFRSFSSQK
ncbi:hypothetical protein RHMOL_Rhmol06G0300000 [Rhododendron molle]|uniref:Uncharacterized protein n=1 Tax=Rhododendron molle TaxID=49168 RepID=A0ACC0NJ65_RHOML|nr:hypothetical protein RHMOL_Rhmol06G0300000 [Rhododendron molle]